MTSPQLGNSWRSTLLRICSQPPCPANLIMANDQYLDRGERSGAPPRWPPIGEKRVRLRRQSRRSKPWRTRALSGATPAVSLNEACISQARSGEQAMPGCAPPAGNPPLTQIKRLPVDYDFVEKESRSFSRKHRHAARALNPSGRRAG